METRRPGSLTAGPLVACMALRRPRRAAPGRPGTARRQGRRRTRGGRGRGRRNLGERLELGVCAGRCLSASAQACSSAQPGRSGVAGAAPSGGRNARVPRGPRQRDALIPGHGPRTTRSATPEGLPVAIPGLDSTVAKRPRGGAVIARSPPAGSFMLERARCLRRCSRLLWGGTGTGVRGNGIDCGCGGRPGSGDRR